MQQVTFITKKGHVYSRPQAALPISKPQREHQTEQQIPKS
jgi:hypothetical protein